MAWDSYQNYISEQIKHEVSLLFQRFNYFLLMTSFLIIAYVTVITSQGFILDSSYKIYWIAQTIAVVGFILSYSFSLVNLMNARLIHDMGLFLENIRVCGYSSLPHFNYYVSHNLVPTHRFRITYFFRIHYHMWYAFIGFFSRSTQSEDAEYKDLAPHTWITPMFFAFVWVAIYSITFLDIIWLLLPTVVVVSFIIYLAYSCARRRK
jgi:hypothetical protein